MMKCLPCEYVVVRTEEAEAGGEDVPVRGCSGVVGYAHQGRCRRGRPAIDADAAAGEWREEECVLFL